jgi:sulfur dioxygenase
MIFRQLFESVSCTYTSLLAARRGAEALIIDPVLEKVDLYLRIIKELDLKLVKAVDTHVHADHVTGLGLLRDRTRCITVMGAESAVNVVSMRVREGDAIEVAGVRLEAVHTPGHTDDSYSFLMEDRVFTGDTLLIRGTGRTDFQKGDPHAQYDSIFNKLLKLPDATLVFPAHDYKGETVSTIAEEKAWNPRLQVGSEAEYVEIMNNLKLDNPKMMDVALPANVAIGAAQEGAAGEAWAITVAEALPLLGRQEVRLVDLREEAERRRDGVIPGSLHSPYPSLGDALRAGGMIHDEASLGGKRLIFYCAFGERSALAVRSAQEAGLGNVCHVVGGLNAWKKEGGPVVTL